MSVLGNSDAVCSTVFFAASSFKSKTKKQDNSYWGRWRSVQQWPPFQAYKWAVCVWGLPWQMVFVWHGIIPSQSRLCYRVQLTVRPPLFVGFMSTKSRHLHVLTIACLSTEPPLTVTSNETDGLRSKRDWQKIPQKAHKRKLKNLSSIRPSKQTDYTYLNINLFHELISSCFKKQNFIYWRCVWSWKIPMTTLSCRSLLKRR